MFAEGSMLGKNERLRPYFFEAKYTHMGIKGVKV